MASTLEARAQPWWRIYFNIASVPFWAMHIAAVVSVALAGFSWAGVAFAGGLYAALMFFVTAGYHRYFSHRSYKAPRWVQFILALGTTLTAQKGPLWWAAHHRVHHRESDTERDPHSPITSGFLWAHLGWILSHHSDSTDYSSIPDLARYPELVWLNRFALVPPVVMGAIIMTLWPTLLPWYFVAVVLTWHGTFTINSLTHVFGKRRYKTSDQSRNHWLLALITHGEGWHNNHHYYQSSCRQGFRWYEIDMSYYVLRAMSFVGLVHSLRSPPRYIVEGVSKPARSVAAVPKRTAPIESQSRTPPTLPTRRGADVADASLADAA